MINKYNGNFPHFEIRCNANKLEKKIEIPFIYYVVSKIGVGGGFNVTIS
jgi:hypothetical protein